jgi:hypothetical protein
LHRRLATPSVRAIDGPPGGPRRSATSAQSEGSRTPPALSRELVKTLLDAFGYQ